MSYIQALKPASLALVVALAACGGGSTDPADKYVGTWDKACTPYNSDKSSINDSSLTSVIVFTKTGASSLSMALSELHYKGTDCKGPSVLKEEKLTVALQGTKTIPDGKTVDRAIATGADKTVTKTIFWFDGNKIFSGDDAKYDAQGYPETLTNEFITRR